MDGLSGVIVVAGEARLLPARLRGITERVFALKDLQAKDGAAVTENLDSGAPTTRTVNGEVDPHVAIRPGETQLWRLANISADIWYRLRADGLRFAVVGEDANPTARVVTARTLLLPPGKRYDVLVQGPRRGTYRLRALRYSTGPAGDDYPERRLATIVSAGRAVPRVALPSVAAAAAGAAPALRRGARRPPAAHRLQRERERQLVLHRRQAVPPRPRRPARGARGDGGVDDPQHLRRAAPVPHPRQRLPGHVDQRPPGPRARPAGHRGAPGARQGRDPPAVHGLHREVRVPLPHPQPRGQRHDGRRGGRRPAARGARGASGRGGAAAAAASTARAAVRRGAAGSALGAPHARTWVLCPLAGGSRGRSRCPGRAGPSGRSGRHGPCGPSGRRGGRAAAPTASAPGARRLDRHRDAVEDGGAGQRLEELLVGEDVRVDAGVLGGHAEPRAADVVAPPVRDRDDAGADVLGDLDGDLDRPRRASVTRAGPPSTSPRRAASSGCTWAVQRAFPRTSTGRLCIHELFERRSRRPMSSICSSEGAGSPSAVDEAAAVGEQRLRRELDLPARRPQDLGQARLERAEVDAVRRRLEVGEREAGRARCAA